MMFFDHTFAASSFFEANNIDECRREACRKDGYLCQNFPFQSQQANRYMNKVRQTKVETASFENDNN
ncbi:hypothetical protein L596_018390 [Steinernema carpocapsae]|uniref:Uncharacterized protein n=1 Tax=Steinernema carpocapsae TaxID=34508 RepID=A0A4U5N4S2_STECR|nr:hypothetical protein L596_018390 [Steinernema carpocapsae]